MDDVIEGLESTVKEQCSLQNTICADTMTVFALYLN